MIISEREISLDEVKVSAKNGHLLEMFLVSTGSKADRVREVFNAISGELIKIPVQEDGLSLRIYQYYADIFTKDQEINNPMIQIY